LQIPGKKPALWKSLFRIVVPLALITIEISYGLFRTEYATLDSKACISFLRNPSNLFTYWSTLALVLSRKIGRKKFFSATGWVGESLKSLGGTYYYDYWCRRNVFGKMLQTLGMPYNHRKDYCLEIGVFFPFFSWQPVLKDTQGSSQLH